MKIALLSLIVGAAIASTSFAADQDTTFTTLQQAMKHCALPASIYYKHSTKGQSGGFTGYNRHELEFDSIPDPRPAHRSQLKLTKDGVGFYGVEFRPTEIACHYRYTDKHGHKDIAVMQTGKPS